MTDKITYKILSAEDWAIAKSEGVSRTALDEGDGYVHLSTRAQVGETLALHYKGADRVRLLEYKVAALEQMGEVRWEASRGGQLFPHLYGALDIEKAENVWVLNLDSASLPKLPEELIG